MPSLFRPLSLRLATIAALIGGILSASASDGEWVSLFDGETLAGWTPNESPESFRVEEGKIVADGPRSHLFYTGPIGDAAFTDFEFSAEVFVHPRGSSAVYFHAENLGPGWTVRGLPVKITNTRVTQTATGGIYHLLETYREVSPVPDGEWFTLRIRVEGLRVHVYLNEALVTDYTQDASTLSRFQQRHLRLGSGTFALQCHGPRQRVDFRKLRVRPIPSS